jgi:hypothetical protein
LKNSIKGVVSRYKSIFIISFAIIALSSYIIPYNHIFGIDTGNSAPIPRIEFIQYGPNQQSSSGSTPSFMESNGASVPKTPPLGKDIVIDPFSGAVLGTKSASAATERSTKTSIQPDVGESEAYKTSLMKGEIGLQRPYKVNVRGPDYITAKRDPNGQMYIVITDVKTSTIGEFPNPNLLPANKWANFARIAAGNLGGLPPDIQKDIQDAVKNNRIENRQVNMDYSSNGQGKMVGCFPTYLC